MNKGDKLTDWRLDPATERQKKRLKAEGIDFPENITKGEASELIGSTVEPSVDEIAVLKFFKVSGIPKMSQTDARRKISELFADEQKVKKWEERPADRTQKDIYKFFNIPLPEDLRYKDAEGFINELFEEEAKKEAWGNHENKLYERESWFEDTLDIINDDRDLYDCKKISKKLFKQIVESLESTGMPLEQIEENQNLIFKRALEIDPDLRKASATSKKSYSSQPTSKRSEPGCSVVLALLSGIIILIVIKLVSN
jgi:hypothetical protein